MDLTLILLAVFCFSSCEKSSNSLSKGTAKFSITQIEALNQTKSAFASDSALVSYHVLVSVEDIEGNPVLTDELIPMYVFGTGFISEEVQLDAGYYNLTKFMIINPGGEVIYASPVEGSPLAYLVDDPLPVRFSIAAGTITTISPEVLPVDDHPPGDFGYVSFGAHIITPLSFYVVCYIDYPYASPLPVKPVTADLTVYAVDGWHYKFALEATVNKLIIRGGYNLYTLLLEKQGYMPQTFYCTAEELKATTKENPLVLKIPWDSNQWKKLVLQPGPEAGVDAMISNLEPERNFGDYKYFEATFLSEPILTVMRSNRSLIWFDLNSLPKSATIRKATLTLWYEYPIPWDSTIFIDPATGSCIWYGAVLQRIIEPWEEMKVTWNTQPKTTELYQVYVSPFNRSVNFIEVDVTSLYAPINTTDSPNYGMLFRLWPYERFPGFRFASSDYPVAGVRPQLTIYYTIPTVTPL